MNEMTIVAIILAGGIPLTAYIVGATCKGIAAQALEHLAKTQVIGGTPKEVFAQKAEVGIERQKQLMAARKPRPVTGVIS